MKPDSKNLLWRSALAASASLTFSTPLAQAADITWANESVNAFEEPAAWIGGIAPTAADRAVFTGAFGVDPLVSTPATLQGLYFSDAAASGYILSGAPITLTNTGTGATTAAVWATNTSGTNTIENALVLGAAAGARQHFRQGTGGHLILSGTISSTNAIAGVNFEDASNAVSAMFTLSAANTYAGTTSIDYNTLNINHPNALSSGALIFTNNGRLNNTSGAAITVANAIIANTSFAFNATDVFESWDLAFTGGTDLSGGNRTLSVGANGGKLSLANVNVGAGNRQHQKSGNGTLAITGTLTGTGSNAAIGGVTYTNCPWRIDAGTLEIASPALLGDSLDLRAGLAAGADLTGANKVTATIVHAANNTFIGGSNPIDLAGPYLLSNGAGNRTLSVLNTAATTFSGPVSLSDATGDNQTLTVYVESTAGPAVISGVIRDTSTGSAAGTFIKSGPGVLTLTAANTFKGGLQVNGGTLVATTPATLGAVPNAITINGGNLHLAATAAYPVAGVTMLNHFDSAITFEIAATSGTGGRLTGSGVTSFDGQFRFKLPDAAPADGATWTIVDPALAATYGANFRVADWTGSAASGGWTASTGTGVYTFSQATGVITYADDADGDGLPTAWEIANGLNPNSASYPNGGGDDPDNDGFSNLDEFAGGSNPNSTTSVPGDTDGDGLADRWEIEHFGNLTAQTGAGDPDGDGADNAAEMSAGSDPEDPAWTPSKAKLVHRWSFNGNLDDSVGSSPAVLVEAGANDAVLDATSVTLAGGAAASSDHVNLGSGLIGGRSTPVTLEFWATPNAIQDGSAIFEAGSSAAESFRMTWTVGNNLNQDLVEWKDLSGTSTAYSTNAPYRIGTPYHLIVTLVPAAYTGGEITSGTKVTWFRAPVGANSPLDVQRGSFLSPNDLSAFNTTYFRLGSALSGGNTASARYDEVRLWDGAFTGIERTVAQAAGPAVTDLTADTDADGLPDAWEIAHFGGLAQGDIDSDGDGELNSAELAQQSNPANPLSNAADIDGDGLNDANFERVYFYDLDEDAAGDWDNDFANNGLEQASLTIPTDGSSWPDTEDSGAGDGLNDGWEEYYFGNRDGVVAPAELVQTADGDPDGDGESNLTEYERGTDPTNPFSRSTLPPLFTLIDANTRNGSFERLGPEPGTVNGAKAAQWDTPGTGDVTCWTEWLTQQTAQGNSGAETGGTNTDGVKHAFMQAGNAVYNLTGYPGSAGTTYWFSIDKANANRLEAWLVYQDASGAVLPVEGSVMESVSASNAQIKGFILPAGSPAVGRPVGIGFKSFESWASFDNVIFGLAAVDADSDGYDDTYEDHTWGNNNGAIEPADLAAGPAGDVDGDGIPTLVELDGSANTAYGNQPTRPNAADSDGDGLSDGQEITVRGTNPNLADTDGDGLSDGAELSLHGTDPLMADSDADGFKDGVEVLYGSDPMDSASIPGLYPLIGPVTRNGSFEQLNGVTSTAKASHWDTDPDGDVNGWTIWTEQSTAANDSGTETTGSAFRDGAKHGYLQSGNAVVNLTGYLLKAGDVVRLTYARTTGGTINAYLVTDTGAGIVQIPGSASPVTTTAANGYELVFAIPEGSPAIGQPVGAAFKSTGGWNGIDQVVLSVKDRDADLDGLSDFWEEDRFGSTTAHNGTGDPDHDGTSNLIEFRLGLDPNDPTSTFKAAGVLTSANGFTLTWPSRTGTTFRIDRSTSLADGSWEVLDPACPGAAGTTTFIDSSLPDGTRAFYRVSLND